MGQRRRIGSALGAALTLSLILSAGSAGLAEDMVTITVPGGDKAMTKSLTAASGLVAAEQEAGKKGPNAQDMFAAARAEYARLLGALYAQGRYSPVIHVLIDGREAADIPPLDAPTTIRRIEVVVDPGPLFEFSKTNVAPLAPHTELPTGFQVGETAESGLISAAVGAAQARWQDTGHPKVKVTGQDIVADHAANTLAVDVSLAPGPKLRFGPLTITGEKRMREERIREIAGLPEGTVWSPEELRKAQQRLRRSGVFSSVTFTQDEAITPPDLLGQTLTVVEEKKRRFGFGADVGTTSGLNLSGFWLHRNLFGGGERLEIEGLIDNIGASDSGVDYTLSFNLSRPATLTPDTTLTGGLSFGRLDEATYTGDFVSVDGGLAHVFSDRLNGSIQIGYDYLKGSDETGDFLYETVNLPMSLTWDNRDNPLDATRGVFVNSGLMPFLGFGETDSGSSFTLDARAYKGLGGTAGDRRVVLAGRIQYGGIFGSTLLGTPRDYLFYSGGGGTVRGQPYQSLFITTDTPGGPLETGGMGFFGASAEVRVKVTETIGVVGFYDWGEISAEPGMSDAETQAGAGLGLRYATSIGPIRLDVAAPVEGDTGDGIQVYIGLGQAF